MHFSNRIADVVAAAPTAVEDRPAGAAALSEVALASGLALAMTIALGAVVIAHRSDRLPALTRLMERMDRSRFFGTVAPWAQVPLMVAMVSLITALLGMYWDIALHIGLGRDEGPLANPAHYPILFGLFGISAAGVLACALPRQDEVGPSGVRLAPGWNAPAGGVLLTGAGTYALLGFPLDDVWHRIFGQDVTLWGPTHLMLIGGAGLSLVAMAVLFEEGRTATERTGRRTSPVATYVLKASLVGGLLIGMSVFQAEFDFGVPQFRLVLQPFLIALAAAFSLVVARLWIGRGAAIAAVLFYLVVRGGVSVVVGPGLGELWAAVPLYLAEAVIVELVALRLAHRPIALGLTSGVLIGTLGYAAEHAWTQIAFPLPWTSDILVEGVAMATVAGAAAGLLGSLLVLGLRRNLPDALRPRLLFALALVAIAACATNGVIATHPEDLHGTVAVSDAGSGQVELEVSFDRDPVAGEPAWLTVTGWQGGAGTDGLAIDHLEEGRDGVWRTTAPVPADGTWKTMVRLHDGRELTAMPVYLPEDAALGEPEIPVEDGTRPFDEEKLLLQRELSDDVPGWLWLAAGSIVLLCSIALVLGLGWGVNRYARASRPDVGAATTPRVPA
ncbi:hypothetical protein [Nocardioides marmotae]|uniref:hypothetical protein n=1 Tax=Nocardioides marmotae TaxID=2663857 RepID=UPI0012B583B1|nr:hypothetical protein [Nocardioides marmotae]MBC9735332.1 hypothetical protein [Nocardioides marmotae]MTB86432.1 hypothetical protein [Nocardioides marmotae]